MPLIRTADAHHFTVGIKGIFIHFRELPNGSTVLFRAEHQRNLRGIAVERVSLPIQAAAVVDDRIGQLRQSSRFPEAGSFVPPIVPVKEMGLHAAFCQRARFIGADAVHTAQGFHGGQTANDGVDRRQPTHPQRQAYRYDNGESFGNRCHTEADAGKDHRVEIAAHHKSGRSHHRADNNAKQNQHFAEMLQLFLQRSKLRFAAVEHLRDLSQLRTHADIHNDAAAAAAGNDRAAVTHIAPLGQRPFRSQRFRKFRGIFGFTGQYGFFRPQMRRFGNADIGGNFRSAFQ